jgi:hypothetical protein
MTDVAGNEHVLMRDGLRLRLVDTAAGGTPIMFQHGLCGSEVSAAFAAAPRKMCGSRSDQSNFVGAFFTRAATRASSGEGPSLSIAKDPSTAASRWIDRTGIGAYHEAEKERVRRSMRQPQVAKPSQWEFFSSLKTCRIAKASSS